MTARFTTDSDLIRPQCFICLVKGLSGWMLAGTPVSANRTLLLGASQGVAGAVADELQVQNTSSWGDVICPR